MISCKAYVYLWKGHPLADESFLTMEQLEKYPCLSFEQGDNSSFYLAEELLPTNEYGQIIHASNPSDGIKISSAYYRKPIKIGRVL